jgi:hypothetical protein
MFRSAALTAMFLATPAFTQDASIEDVITNQLKAFNDRDVTQAWQYASPMIQGMFGSPDNFGMMVERGYPMVWDNSNVRFLDRQDFDSRTRQEVMITGPDGQFYILDYQMIETPDGWLINGVQVIPAPDIFS